MQVHSFDPVEARREPREAESSRFGTGADTGIGTGPTATYRLLVAVEGGLHRGAAFVARPSRDVRLGQAADCDLVLMDIGVSEHSVRLFEQCGRLGAEVMAAGVQRDGQVLPMGVHRFDPARVELRVGGALIKVELLRRSRPSPAAAVPDRTMRTTPTPRVRARWGTFAALGLLTIATFALVGGAVNASSYRNGSRAAATLEGVVVPFNARGAQIAIVSDGHAEPVLRGFIADASMRDELDRAVRAAGLRAQLQLRDVQQMADSLTRLARLTGHECEARHLSGGRFDCRTGVLDVAALARLRSLVVQVPGAVSLDVQARPLESAPAPVVVVAPEPTAEPPKVPTRPALTPPLPVIRHVAVGPKESFAYDVDGRRLRVGDIVNGARVMRVRFEAVDLMLEGRRYSVAVTPMLSFGSGAAAN